MPVSKNESSKFWPKVLRWFNTPIAFIGVFALGLLTAELLLKPLFILETAVIAFLAGLTFYILNKRSLIGLVLIFVLSLGYFHLFSRLNTRPIAPGCTQAFITSNPKEIGTYQEFLLEDSGGRKAVVDIKSGENFQYNDQVDFCFDEKSIVLAENKNSHYLKAQYKTDYLIKPDELKKQGDGAGAVRSLYSLARDIKNRIFQLFGGDIGVLANGLLIGGSSGFSDSFKAALKNSGTTHLVAVSGYNVSIITIILFQFIRSAFSRRSAIAFSLIFLITFCVLTGATASVLRASLMGLLYIIAKIIGRRGAILNSLFLAAFLMLLLNPYSLWDVGFQLSFAATLGLIVLAGPLNLLIFSKVTQEFWKSLGLIFCETIGAQILTFPILVSVFGRISLVSPITNLLILPVVPLAMFLIFISLIGSYLWPLLAIFLAGFTKIVLVYIATVIEFFGNLKFAALELTISNWIVVLGLYALILFLTILVKTKVKKPNV